MKLFITFGSFGEIAPLLEIALRYKERGEEVAFLTSNWTERVQAYGIKCYALPFVKKHKDTLDAFVRAHVLGKQQAIFETIEAIKPTSIISAFFCFPAEAYADKYNIPYLPTTCSPYYFTQTESVPAFNECMTEYTELRKRHGITKGQDRYLAGLYPWYLHDPCGPIRVGFPELRSLLPLSAAVAEFIKQDYGVVSRGTLVGRGDLDRMINSIKAHGLKCLYLGPYECDADMIAYLDDHKEAVKNAKVAITHAGIGTTIDCMGSPMVVDPVGYDQFYNASRLVDLCCAVPFKGSWIKAIEAAQAPRSYLPNFFDFDLFEELHEHPSRHARRSSANVGERAQVH